MLPVVSLQLIQSFMLIPWLTKPLLGYLTDNHEIFGSRRKSYLILSCLFEISLYLIFSFLPKDLFISIILNFGIVLSIVFKNVIAEALTVEVTQNAQTNIEITKKFISSESNYKKEAKLKLKKLKMKFSIIIQFLKMYPSNLKDFR